jgi:hypothetical protein
VGVHGRAISDEGYAPSYGNETNETVTETVTATATERETAGRRREILDYGPAKGRGAIFSGVGKSPGTGIVTSPVAAHSAPRVNVVMNPAQANE